MVINRFLTQQINLKPCNSQAVELEIKLHLQHNILGSRWCNTEELEMTQSIPNSTCIRPTSNWLLKAQGHLTCCQTSQQNNQIKCWGEGDIGLFGLLWEHPWHRIPTSWKHWLLPVAPTWSSSIPSHDCNSHPPTIYHLCTSQSTAIVHAKERHPDCSQKGPCTWTTNCNMWPFQEILANTKGIHSIEQGVPLGWCQYPTPPYNTWQHQACITKMAAITQVQAIHHGKNSYLQRQPGKPNGKNTHNGDWVCFSLCFDFRRKHLGYFSIRFVILALQHKNKDNYESHMKHTKEGGYSNYLIQKHQLERKLVLNISTILKFICKG